MKTTFPSTMMESAMVIEISQRSYGTIARDMITKPFSSNQSRHPLPHFRLRGKPSSLTGICTKHGRSCVQYPPLLMLRILKLNEACRSRTGGTSGICISKVRESHNPVSSFLTASLILLDQCRSICKILVFKGMENLGDGGM